MRTWLARVLRAWADRLAPSDEMIDAIRYAYRFEVGTLPDAEIDEIEIMPSREANHD